MNNVTVIADVKLGGVEREYTEVKRKANVGDVVRVDFSEECEIPAGTITRCIKAGDFEDGSIDVDFPSEVYGDYSFLDADSDNYAVLEPTDIIRLPAGGRVDGVRYRMVERKAAVGELVIATDEGIDNGRHVKIGEHGRVTGRRGWSADDVHVKFPCGKTRYIGPSAGNSTYAVLEPVESAVAVKYHEVERKANVGERIRIVEPLMSGGNYVKGDEFIAAASKWSGIDVALLNGAKYFVVDSEYVVLELVATAANTLPTAAPAPPESDIQRTVDGLLDAVTNLTRRVTELERGEYVQIASGTIEKAVPSYVTRDSIVEQAKRDVAELERTPRDVYGDHPHFWPKVDGEETIWIPIQTVEYVINREKGTVVALILRLTDRDVFARGIAKCAPDDVFNVHIGKAIAIRRALGLEVPEEYIKAPQPTEVRVGDYVYYTKMFPRLLVTKDVTNVFAIPPAVGLDFLGTTNGKSVIDDSREKVAVVATVANPEPTYTVVASRSGHNGYLTKGHKYWVAEVSGSKFRLVEIGAGKYGGVWCGRDEFVFGTEAAV